MLLTELDFYDSPFLRNFKPCVTFKYLGFRWNCKAEQISRDFESRYPTLNDKVIKVSGLGGDVSSGRRRFLRAGTPPKRNTPEKFTSDTIPRPN